VARPPGRTGATLAVLAALVVVVATQYAGALRVPFINDDYVFLDKVRAASFRSLWGVQHVTFQWYRPWSRELHYWTLSHLFGEREAPFHVASLMLWLATLVLYFTLARRMAGERVAAVAVAGHAVLAAWAVPVLWIAGVQDLWMLCASLLALHAFVRERPLLASLAFAVALLSKETAATLPAIAFVYAAWVERRGLVGALRRVAPLVLVTIVWALVHPRFGGHWLRGVHVDPGPAVAPVSHPLARTVLSVLNLDHLPDPVGGLGHAALVALPAIAVLAALVVWLARPPRRALRGNDAGPHGAMGFGLAWALLAWLPLALPGLGWHAYYALAGAFGAWLAIATVLARSPGAAAAVVSALALIRAAHAVTPSMDWGTEWYQRRAGAFLDYMRGDLLRKEPHPPQHARLFFVGVPSNVGFITEGAPALRVWYRDTTLSGGLFGEYTKRRDGGPDRFFRYDSTTGWTKLEAGDEDVDAAQARNPHWKDDTQTLAAMFARADDWSPSARQHAKLSRAEPDSLEHMMDAGVASAMAGDTVAATSWVRRVAESPQASDSLRAEARRILVELRPSRAP
jgi:hypothetical protein